MNPSTRIFFHAGFTALEWECAKKLNLSYNGAVWICVDCGHVEHESIKLLMHMLRKKKCGNYSLRAGIDELDFAAMLAVLAAADWKSYQGWIEFYVGMWETGKLDSIDGSRDEDSGGGNTTESKQSASGDSKPTKSTPVITVCGIPVNPPSALTDAQSKGYKHRIERLSAIDELRNSYFARYAPGAKNLKPTDSTNMLNEWNYGENGETYGKFKSSNGLMTRRSSDIQELKELFKCAKAVNQRKSEAGNTNASMSHGDYNVSGKVFDHGEVSEDGEDDELADLDG